MNYAEKLNQTRNEYPFAFWMSSGIAVYSEENCGAMREIFDDLIDALIEKGENASETEKMDLFYRAIKRTNELDDKTQMVETGERENLCELTNVITVAAGLNPEKYGNGEGLASEWRDW